MKRTLRRIAASLLVLGPIVAILAGGGDGPPPRVLARVEAQPTPTVPSAPTTSTTATTVTVAATTVVTHPNREAEVDTAAPSDVGRDALRLITYPWADLDVDIVFGGPNPSMRAPSDLFSDHHQITVFVRRTDTARTVAVSIAHEIGHLIDFERLTDADRQEWLQERGRPDAGWWTCSFCDDFHVGSGDFAETFAAWLVGPADYRSQLAPLPSADEMQSLSRFFRL